MKKIHLITSLLISAAASTSFSCVRSDLLPDRTSEEALQRSLKFAQTLDPGKVSVLISCLDENRRIVYEGSGVAIDRHTILTAAHVVYGYSRIVICNNVSANGCRNVISDIKEKIIHPNFSPAESRTTGTKKPRLLRKDEKGSYEIFAADYRGPCDYDEIGEPVNISTISEMTLEELTSTDCLRTEATKNDLAILKLTTPLAEDLPYPVLSTVSELNDQDGVAIGWGIPRYNRQLEGAAETEYRFPTKHLISCKVNTNTTLHTDEKILNASYKGLLINGCKSFIPDSAMIKTTGLPVHGDSGGGFFIKSSDNPTSPYILAGIQSQILSLYSTEIENPRLRNELAHNVQPIHSLWTDITHHTDWITRYRG